MALAVLDRLRELGDSWAIEVDLSRGPVLSSSTLAERLADQARAAGVHLDGRAREAVLTGRQALRAGEAVKAAGALLGIGSVEEAGQLAQSIDQALGPVDEGPTDLRSVLAAVSAAALAADRLTLLFIDEIQRLGTDWGEEEDSVRAQEMLAEVMEQSSGRLVVLLAGSDRSAVERLLAQGQPLHHDGMTFRVPPIQAEDWRHSLAERFGEVSLEVTSDLIDQILAASEGHPQRTMRVCAHVHQLAGESFADVTEVLVDAAIASAREHPSWSD